MQAFIPDVHVGHHAITEKFRDRVTIHRCRSGIGQIEELLSGHAGEALAVEHPNLAQLINNGPMRTDGWRCTHATAKFSPLHLREVVNRTRQTALRLCLECEAKGIDLQFETDDSTTPRERKAWMDTLKAETTKAAVRQAWDIARDYFSSGGASAFP